MDLCIFLYDRHLGLDTLRCLSNQTRKRLIYMFLRPDIASWIRKQFGIDLLLGKRRYPSLMNSELLVLDLVHTREDIYI